MASKDRDEAASRFSGAVQTRTATVRAINSLAAEAAAARRTMFEQRLAKRMGEDIDDATPTSTVADVRQNLDRIREIRERGRQGIRKRTSQYGPTAPRPAAGGPDTPPEPTAPPERAPAPELPPISERPTVAMDPNEPSLKAALNATWNWLDAARGLVLPDSNEQLLRLGSDAMTKSSLAGDATRQMGDILLPQSPADSIEDAQGWLRKQREADERAQMVLDQQMRMSDVMRPPPSGLATEDSGSRPGLGPRQPGARHEMEAKRAARAMGEAPEYLKARRAKRDAEVERIEAELTETWGTFDATVEEEQSTAQMAQDADTAVERETLSGAAQVLNASLAWLQARGSSLQSALQLARVEEDAELMMLAPGGEWEPSDDAAVQDVFERLEQTMAGLPAKQTDRALPSVPTPAIPSIPDPEPEPATEPTTEPAEDEPAADALSPSATWTGSDPQFEQLVVNIAGAEGWGPDFKGRTIRKHVVGADGVYLDAGGKWATGYGQTFATRAQAQEQSRKNEAGLAAGKTRAQVTQEWGEFARHYRPVERAQNEHVLTTNMQMRALFSLSWQGPFWANMVVDSLSDGTDKWHTIEQIMIRSTNAQGSDYTNLELYERRAGELADIFGVTKDEIKEHISETEAVRRRRARESQ